MKKILLFILLMANFYTTAIAQFCCGCYEKFEIIDGIQHKETMAKYCFDAKGKIISSKGFVNKGKDTIDIGEPFSSIYVENIERKYQGEQYKIRKSKAEISIKFRRNRNEKEVTYRYKINDGLVTQFAEKEIPFGTKYTSYYYDNLNRISLISDYFEGNKIIETVQFLYGSDLISSNFTALPIKEQRITSDGKLEMYIYVPVK
jgi:hypothetical protein